MQEIFRHAEIATLFVVDNGAGTPRSSVTHCLRGISKAVPLFHSQTEDTIGNEAAYERHAEKALNTRRCILRPGPAVSIALWPLARNA